MFYQFEVASLYYRGCALFLWVSVTSTHVMAGDVLETDGVQAVAIEHKVNAAPIGSKFGSTLTMETVIVSGSRTASDQFETPYSISVLDQPQIELVRAQHPSKILQAVPGVWVSRGNGQEHLTAIRSPVFTGPGACGNFLIAQDSIAVRASAFCNVNQLFDTFFDNASRVESFRGPGSTIFGGNALYGGINIISPEFNRSSQLSLLTGNNDLYQLSWNLSVPKNMFYGSISDYSGWRDESGYRQQKVAYKNALSLGDWSVVNHFTFNQLEQETAGFIEGMNAYRDITVIKMNNNPNAFRDAQSMGYSSVWHRQVSPSSHVEIAPYLRLNHMQFLMHFLPWQPLERNKHNSYGLQLKWQVQNDKGWQWSLGSDIESTRGSLHELQSQAAPFAQERFPQGDHYNYTVDIMQGAVYSLLKYMPSDRLSLHADVRLDAMSYDYSNHLSSGSGCDAGVSQCRFFRPPSATSDYSFSSYRLAFNYGAFNNRLGEFSVYGNTGRSFRAPHTAELYRLQAPIEQNRGLDETSLTGSEVGVRLNGERMTLRVAYYVMHNKNGIFQANDRSYLMGAKSSHRGLEYELKASLSDRLNVSISGSEALHKYENSPSLLGIKSPIAGLEMDTAPRRHIHFNLHWQVTKAWSIYTTYSKIGDYFLDPENQFRYEGHALLDIAVNWKIDKYQSLQLNIKNTLDKRYAERADVAFGEYRYFPGQPRHGSLSWAYKF